MLKGITQQIRHVHVPNPKYKSCVWCVCLLYHELCVRWIHYATCPLQGMSSIRYSARFDAQVQVLSLSGLGTGLLIEISKIWLPFTGPESLRARNRLVTSHWDQLDVIPKVQVMCLWSRKMRCPSTSSESIRAMNWGIKSHEIKCLPGNMGINSILLIFFFGSLIK